MFGVGFSGRGAPARKALRAAQAPAEYRIPLDGGDAGKLQEADEQAGVVIGHALSEPHLAVEVKKRGAVVLAAQQPLADEDQVVVLLAGAARQEEPCAQPVHHAPTPGPSPPPPLTRR